MRCCEMTQRFGLNVPHAEFTRWASSQNTATAVKDQSDDRTTGRKPRQIIQNPVFENEFYAHLFRNSVFWFLNETMFKAYFVNIICQQWLTRSGFYFHLDVFLVRAPFYIFNETIFCFLSICIRMWFLFNWIVCCSYLQNLYLLP